MQHWSNFDIEFFDHDTVGDVESVKVRVARSPAGVQRDAVRVVIPAALRSAVDQLASDALNLQQTMEMGQLLAEVLLPRETNSLFENSCAQLQPEEGLRIRIELRSLPLADLPWEYVYQRPANFDKESPERGFLALNRTLSVVRYEPVAQAQASCAPLAGEPVEVAMLLANPEIPGWGALDLEREIKAVESAVGDEPDVSLSIHRNATNRSLNDTLDARPHVFHFAGHGRFKMQPSEQFGVYVGQGELLFETESGGVDPVPAATLASRMRGSGVRLAVLNSCESARRDELNAFTGVAPTLVRDGVPAVVAMQYNIRDAHALQFARRLYHNLAEHQSIDDAVTAARLAMFKLGGAYTRDWGIPVLYLRSDQAVLFPDESAVTMERSQKFGKRGVLNTVLATILVFAVASFYLIHIEPRIPSANLIGGVLLVALMSAGAFLKTVAGDSLLGKLVHWLRRRVATGWLLAAIAAVATGLAFSAEPVVVRVVPGKSLMSLVPAAELSQPLRVYKLRAEADGRFSSSEDFRKSGVTIAGSSALADRLERRYAVQRLEEFDGYLRDEGLSQFGDAFLKHWRQQPELLDFSQLGNVENLIITLEQSGALVSCKRVALTGNMTVVILEKMNECE